MALASRRRARRKPRWLLIGALLTLAVVTVNATLSARSKEPGRRLAQLSYLDRVRPYVEQSTAQGAEIALVRSDAVKLGREGVRRKLDRVARQAQEVLASVQREEPPDALSTSHSLLVASMAVRAKAIASLRDALGRLTARQSPASSIDELAGAGEDIVAADRTYQVFLDSLPASPEGVMERVMPPSRWTEDAALWSRAELVAFAGAFRASAAPGSVRDVAVVVVTTDPAAVASEGGSSVLPLTKGLKLEAVVANVGNEIERRVPVVATLRSPTGKVDSARDFVDLAPAQRRVVTLGGLQPAAGPPSTLSVVVGPVADEGSIVDNGFTMSLLVRG